MRSNLKHFFLLSFMHLTEACGRISYGYLQIYATNSTVIIDTFKVLISKGTETFMLESCELMDE
jgi:hypothetical protein